MCYFRFRWSFWIFGFKPFFDRKLGFKGTNGAYIRDQEVKIYKIRHFVWNFSQICKKSEFWRPYWIFWPAILTRSKWRRKLKFGSATSYDYGYLNYEFQENRIKTLTVTVPPWPHTKWLPWRHQLCKWAKTQTHTTRPMGDHFVKVWLKSAW